MKFLTSILKSIKYFIFYFFVNLLSKKKSKISGNIISKKYLFNSYKIYLIHQKLKFFFYKKAILNSFDNQVDGFKKLFSKLLIKYDPLPKNAICLAARTGAEVKALREIGILAIGYDINFPKNSPYVMYGDFHNIPCESNLFDLLYCNSIDHVKNLDTFFKECQRLINNKGIIVFDLVKGSDELKNQNMYGVFESLHWKKIDDLLKIFTKELKILEKFEISNNRVIVVMNNKWL